MARREDPVHLYYKFGLPTINDCVEIGGSIECMIARSY